MDFWGVKEGGTGILWGYGLTQNTVKVSNVKVGGSQKSRDLITDTSRGYNLYGKTFSYKSLKDEMTTGII